MSSQLMAAEYSEQAESRSCETTSSQMLGAEREFETTHGGYNQ